MLKFIPHIYAAEHEKWSIGEGGVLDLSGLFPLKFFCFVFESFPYTIHCYLVLDSVYVSFGISCKLPNISSILGYQFQTYKQICTRYKLIIKYSMSQKSGSFTIHCIGSHFFGTDCRKKNVVYHFSRLTG